MRVPGCCDRLPFSEAGLKNIHDARVSKFRRRFYTCKNFDYNQAPFNTIARSHAPGGLKNTAAEGRSAQRCDCQDSRAQCVPGRVKDDPVDEMLA